jgi:hypothetical protein
VNRTQFATATPRSFATTLACEVLAHHLKAAEAAEARLVQQLYRKGRPLYDVLRPASPSFKSKAFARRESLGLDAVTNRGPRSTRLEVDQVVPLNDIIWMNGFMELMTAIVAVPCHRQADRGGWQLPDGRFARHPGATLARTNLIGRSGRQPPVLTCVFAPRVGVEPTSLVLIQSQAGPAGRPTGECVQQGSQRR